MTRNDRSTRRNDYIALRVPGYMSEAVRRHADRRGWSISEWIRVAVDAALAAEGRATR